MAHRHLILAYVAAFVIQFGYLGWVGLKYRALRKLERQFPAYTPRIGESPSQSKGART